MIDIETLGTTQDAVILQIAAIGFAKDGRDTLGWEGDVTIQDQLDLGRTIDPATVAWWIDKTSPNARENVFGRNETIPYSLKEALELLNNYIEEHLLKDNNNNTSEDRIWANSPAFDLAIIRNAMESCGITPCWKYWQEADYRTLKYIGSANRFTDTIPKYPTDQQSNSMLENRTPHCAMDDALVQLEYVTRFLLECKNTIKG